MFTKGMIPKCFPFTAKQMDLDVDMAYDKKNFRRSAIRKKSSRELGGCWGAWQWKWKWPWQWQWRGTQYII